MREAHGRRSCHVERKVQADLTPRSGRTRQPGPDVQPLAKEGEVVRAQPVVAEEDICVAVHVTLHEGRLLLEAAERQPRRQRSAGRARRPAGAAGLPLNDSVWPGATVQAAAAGEGIRHRDSFRAVPRVGPP